MSFPTVVCHARGEAHCVGMLAGGTLNADRERLKATASLLSLCAESEGSAWRERRETAERAEKGERVV